MHRSEGQLLRGGLPGRLHPPDSRRTRLRLGRAALHRPRGMHRLRRLRRGVPRRRVLRRGPGSRRVEPVHPDQRRLLQVEGLAKPLRDVGGPGLRVLFVGINPSLRSAEAGHHFARPRNRFWPALHAAGFPPRRLSPEEDGELPALAAAGITNLVARPTRAAAELSGDELREGARELELLVADWQPRLVAMVGVTAYRTAFARPKAGFGLQDDHAIAARPVWVLPNPSGLNAHYQLPRLAEVFREARVYAERLAS